MPDDEFLKFNNGKSVSFKSLNRDININDVADEKLKKLLKSNVFDINGNGIIEAGTQEALNLLNAIKTAASKNSSASSSVFENDEIQKFFSYDETEEAPVTQTADAQTYNDYQTEILEEQQCREATCQIIYENLREAFEVFNSQHLGSISGAYDNAKDEDDKLKTSNIYKVLKYQVAGLKQIIEAKNQKLTRRQYYEENKQRIKDMIFTRLNVLKISTGTSYIDFLRGKYSKDEMTEIINAYVERLCSDADINKLKGIQQQFVSYNQVEEYEALSKFVKNAKDFHEFHDTTIVSEGLEVIKNPDKEIDPSYWDSDELVSFKEVYKLERGVEYSQYKVERYVQAKCEMEAVINAYNKKQQFVDFTETLKREELSLSEKEEKMLSGYKEFYALSEDGGLSQLQKIIDKYKLPVTIEDGKLNYTGCTDDAGKISVLNKLLKLSGHEKEYDFKVFLGDKTLAEYQQTFEQSANAVLGKENVKLLADAMVNDNMGMIKRYTGNASMVGMALTVVGGMLYFTPLALWGGIMVTAGKILAIGGMVAKTGLGVADYATKEVQSQEELEELAKDFIVDAGGFIIGMKAGQTGMKVFSKLIDKKLAVVFGEQIAAGNKAQALKTVISNPEYLKSFAQAAGAKISVDFLISYMGDLAMMGVLDTQDDWKSLLQANLTGILVGMSGDVKDAAGVGKAKGSSVANAEVKQETRRVEEPQKNIVMGAVETSRTPQTGDAGQTQTKGEMNKAEIKMEKTPTAAKAEFLIIEDGGTFISIADEHGNNVGIVLYDLRTQNNQKVLHFEGLKSSQSGKGIGTQLIKELVKKSKELGAEGRLVASASPSGRNSNGQLTNLEFYYKLGFRAVDEDTDLQILNCIDKGQEIPLALNCFTDIYLTSEGIERLGN